MGNNIFKISFVESCTSEFWGKFLSIVVAVGLFFLLHEIFNIGKLMSAIISGIVVFIAFCILFYFFYMKNKMLIKRTNIISHLTTICSQLHMFKRAEIKGPVTTENLYKVMFVPLMNEMCNILKKIFDELEKSNICISLKVIEGRETIWESPVRNVCRDSRHKGRDFEEYSKVDHLVSKNTSYAKVINNVSDIEKNKNDGLNNNDVFYVNRNVKENDGNYQNSSIGLQDKLPYKSAFVYPIIPKQCDIISKESVLGFLCIDSPNKGKFKKISTILPIMELITDEMYDIMNYWFKNNE